MRCIIGIDAGTTHLKCAMIGLDGRILAVEKAATPVCSDGDASWYDPQQIYGTVRTLIRRLVAGDGTDGLGDGICGISITGMSEAGLVLERESGRELTEILPWFDRRTETLARQTGPEEARNRFLKTGLYNSFKYGIYKYLWLLEKRGLARENTIWLSMCDYLAFRLTGRYATTAGFAVRTYAYDMERGCWDGEYLGRFGLTQRQFPQVVRDGEAIGSCADRELAELLGENVKVAIGGHDHICALYAMAGENGLRMADSSGTAETYMGITEKRSLSHEDYARGVVYGPYPGGGKWFWMGNLPSSGQAVEWYRGQLRADVISYEEMERMLERLAGRPTGALYFPFMNGVGTPVYRGDVQPRLEGLKEPYGTGEILKAVIEGVQYQGRWILECAPVDPENPDLQLWCAGGAAASREWMQIKADVLGIPVHVPVQEEATLLGAAAVFLRENGTEQELGAFLRAMEQERAVYLPDDENRKRYRGLAEKYRRLAREMCGLDA